MWNEQKRAALDALERAYWPALWEQCRGNISEMSRVSGCSRVLVRIHLRRVGGRMPGTAGRPAKARGGG